MKRKDLFAVFLTLTTLLSCAEQADNTIVLDSVDDLAGLRVACSTGSYYEHQLSARKDIDLFIVNTEADGMQALRENMADVFVTDEIMLTEASMRELGVKKAMRGEESFDVAFAVKKGNTDLLKQLNAFLSGPEIKDVVAYWTEGAEDVRPAIPEISPGGKPLRCIAAVNLEPTSYVGDGGEWVGLDPDLLRRFAAFAGRSFEMKFQDIGSAMIALQTGQVDVVSACLFVTEERKKSVDFTIPYYHCHPGYFVADRGNAHRDGFQERLRRNLLTESRWKLITGGLAKTLEITLFAILLGTVVGALVCAAKRSRRKWLRQLADLYGAFIEGIPTLVLLLIMFYVVFAGSGVNATAVAIVTFACTFAASAGSIFNSAISAIPYGQTEAGLALGFTPLRTFTGIVLPQAVQKGLPLYIGACVSLLKETSIVGYIAIQDLTRASDLIRSRTFDALIPLMLVTLLYFLIAWVIRILLNLFLKKKQHD